MDGMTGIETSTSWSHFYTGLHTYTRYISHSRQYREGIDVLDIDTTHRNHLRNRYIL